jgi:hypothetical protein
VKALRIMTQIQQTAAVNIVDIESCIDTGFSNNRGISPTPKFGTGQIFIRLLGRRSSGILCRGRRGWRISQGIG